MTEKQLVVEVRNNNEDFEWYPTPDVVIEKVAKDLTEGRLGFNIKIMDIGAGNGRVLEKIEKFIKENVGYPDYYQVEKYAIEKSMKLMEHMADDIFIIGTDFYSQTLLDKKMDVIFCNPPYSEYENWVVKIVTEGNAKFIYLLIPVRWKNNKIIKQALESRNVEYEVIMEYDFMDSDLRQARAKTELVKITLRSGAKDPFKSWFESNFKIHAEKEKYYYLSQYELERETKKKVKNELVERKSLVETLENLYNQDMDKLVGTFKKLEELDAEIFNEMEIDWDSILEKFRLKIKNLKNVYWNILIDNLDAITNRLTAKYRRIIFDNLTAHTEIDFTAQNAYAVILWIIKNANKYFDKQLLDIYDKLFNIDNIKPYKSNRRFLSDDWRYTQEKPTHCYLDYRIVYKGYCNFTEYSYDSVNGLYEETAKFLDDIAVIGRNLGFDVVDKASSFMWGPKKENVFYYYNPATDSYEEFMAVRCYKNGNIHFKFSQDFIKKLNIEAGRLKGWLNSPQDAVNEMENVTIDDARNSFGTNFIFNTTTVKQLPFYTNNNE